jgi:beta-galactosidase
MQLFPRRPDTLFYGGDYNPEQWPEAVWPEDVRLMREAGVNLVSLAIFSWSRLQPDPETFTFDWLDRIMNLLHEGGIGICLATATASPPPWLSRLHPEVLPVTADGVVLHPGSRQHYSPSSPEYRSAAARLVRAIAERYRDHPALVAWHINNEYACHMNECHNAASTRGFRQWLRRRYGTLDALNAAWNTAFWSQTYYDWDEIFTPRKAPYDQNPAQCLDFKRFTSDAFLECCLLEKAILREVTPDVPVTTNFMSFFKPLDYWKWAQELDFTSWDSYPDPIDEAAGRAAAAMGHDLTRSLKPDRPFVLLEQATSAVNWRPINLVKRPGLMRLWSLQTVARGGDGVMFFQWRASRAGAEKYHAALVQHAGTGNNRVWREVCALGEEMGNLAPLAGSTIAASVGILVDWNAWWALELPSKPAKLDYLDSVTRLHRWFYERNIPVKFVHPDASFDDCKLLIAPTLYLLSEGSAENLRGFVQQGGSLVTTYFSAIVDEHDGVHLGGYPGVLRDVLGISIEEFSPYPPERKNTLRFGDGTETTCSRWCDIMHLHGAQAVATFAEDFFAGQAAVTRHTFGRGTAFHVGTEPEANGWTHILEEACRTADVAPLLEVPPGIEVTQREKDGINFWSILNHTDELGTLSNFPADGTNLLTKTSIKRGQSIAIEALGAVFVQEEHLPTPV